MNAIPAFPLLRLIAGAILIAAAPILTVLCGGVSTGGVGMWDAAFWRVFIGASAMAPVLFFCPRFRYQKESGTIPPLIRLRSAWWWLPGVAFAFDFGFWHWSFEHTSVANSTLLANTAIFWVSLFAWLFWREKIFRTFIFGALVAFAGAALLILHSGQHGSPTGSQFGVFGDFLALVTAVFYAAYQLSTKYYRREHPAPLLMFWASLVAAIFLFPLAWLHPDPLIPSDPRRWIYLIALGGLAHGGGQGLIASALGSLPAGLASVILLIQPLMAAVLGGVILGQTLHATQIFGAILILGGLAWVILGHGPSRNK